MKRITHTNYLLALGLIFSLWWVVLAISPYDRADWLLENVLVFLFVIAALVSYRRFPLSRVSYTLIFVFLCLHEIGAHYTYAKVPYEAWSSHLLGHGLNEVFGLERNHFDRVIHFAYGALLAYPIREVYVRIAQAEGFWAYFLPLDLTMSTSMLFELFEWGAAEFFGGDLGMAYLGTQGDIWDAHKDMVLASMGAFVAMSITAAINIRLQRDFALEWANSLKVKGVNPLGEDEILRMLEEKRKGG
jgi:putative membrane protein